MSDLTAGEPLSWGNVNKPVVKVLHQNLTRVNEDSIRVWCPVCEHGLLPTTASLGSLELFRLDRCVLCGQQFWYMDVEVDGRPFLPQDPYRMEEVLAILKPRAWQEIAGKTAWERLEDRDE